MRHLDDNISERFIQHLLVGPYETINDLFMFKAESDEYLELLILSGLLIFNLHRKVLVNRLHQSILVLAVNGGINLNSYLLLDGLCILHNNLDITAVLSALGIPGSVSSPADLHRRSSP